MKMGMTTDTIQNEEIREHLQTLRLLSETTDDYLYMADLTEEKMYFANSAISSRYNISLSKENTCSVEAWSRIIYERDVVQWKKDIRKIQEKKSHKHNLVYRLREKNGNLVWISCRGKVLENEEGEPIIMLGRISDTALLGKVDSLTCLFMEEEMYRNLKKAVSAKKSGVLMVFGVDRFKSINAKYGRKFGDYLLKRLASYLEKWVDKEFQVYRLDSDRFAVNFVGYDENRAKETYEQIKNGMTENCSVSAGAVRYPVRNSKDVNALYNYAERSLDRAKQNGRNQLVFFSEEDYEKKLSEIDLIEELNKSVNNRCKGFYLVYQPQVSLNGYEVVGAEALLRFQSAIRGVVSPEQFVPILEKSGMIVPVGKWILEHAIHQCALWRQHNPQFRMSINLSYVQLEQNDLIQFIFGLLEQENLPGSAIILEVTESMQLQDYPRYNQLFDILGKRGIQISMDDFGTGYSSLGYLKSLSVDEIKIDRCFVNNIHLSTYNYKLLSNILELAKSSKIRVVCEGVETYEELRTLSDLEPEEIQGFYFSRPLESGEFTNRYLLSHNEEEKWKVDNHELTVGASQGSIIDYKQVLDSMSEAVSILDEETKCLCYMNRAAQKLLGAKEDYIGKTCYQMLGKDKICEGCKYRKIQETEEIRDYLIDCQGHRYLAEVKNLDWGGYSLRFVEWTDRERIKLFEK